MGHGRALEMFALGRVMGAKEAENCGLVTRSFPEVDFEVEVGKKIDDLAEMPIKVRSFSSFSM